MQYLKHKGFLPVLLPHTYWDDVISRELHLADDETNFNPKFSYLSNKGRKVLLPRPAAENLCDDVEYQLQYCEIPKEWRKDFRKAYRRLCKALKKEPQSTRPLPPKGPR